MLVTGIARDLWNQDIDEDHFCMHILHKILNQPNTLVVSKKAGADPAPNVTAAQGYGHNRVWS